MDLKKGEKGKAKGNKHARHAHTRTRHTPSHATYAHTETAYRGEDSPPSPSHTKNADNV